MEEDEDDDDVCDEEKDTEAQGHPNLHRHFHKGRGLCLPAVPSGTASPPCLLPVEQPAGLDADAVVACLHLRDSERN